MSLTRRDLLIATGSMLAAGTARAATYPDRPVRLLVGFPSGSGPDLVGRVLADWLSRRLGQSFIVEPKPGAGSNVATEQVIKSPADGYTLLMASGSNAWNATLYQNLSYDFLTSVTPVGRVYRAPAMFVVHPDVPAKTTAEFIAYAKANPNKINMASNGNGSTGHIYGGLFTMLTGTQMVHVPYRDNPLPDLIAGRTQVSFSPISSAAPFVQDGKLRALGVTSLERWYLLPELPTVAEAVPGFDAGGWMGIAGPRNLPSDVVDRLNREISAAIADPTFRTRIGELGGEAIGGTPAEFGTFMADYTQKWAKVIRFANIKID